MSCANPSSSGIGSGSGGNNGSGNNGNSNNGPCGACKFLRRKCVLGCIFAPYFDSEQGASHFASVHKVFGASNVSKLLLHIPVHKRLDAVVTICYEAQARLRDPVYGCVSHIFALQQQVVNLQTELTYLQAHLSALEIPTPPPLPPQPMMMPQQLSIADLPPPATDAATYDLSSLFDPMAQQPSWSMHQSHQRAPMDRQFGPLMDPSPNQGPTSSSARGLLNRHGSPPIGHMHDHSPSSSMSK